MSEFGPVLLLVLMLLAAVYVVTRVAGLNRQPRGNPPGTAPGTLSLGQFAVPADRRWMLITPGSF